MRDRLSHRLIILLPLLVVAALFVAPIVLNDSSGASLAEPTVAVIAVVPSFTPSVVPTPIDTATPTIPPTPSATLAPGVTPSPTTTPSPRPTDTATVTATPTSRPKQNPTAAVTGVGRLREGIPTPATPIPSPVPTFDVSERDFTNILLLGSDTDLETGDARTDTIIIVSIDHERETAAMLSIPRDLLVYLPGRTMGRINTALSLDGIDLLKQAILYNFGVPIHYYARIDFEGFQSVVDSIGGVDIAVSCHFQDWRLKSPELDPELEENWAIFALEPSVYHMDGDMALWYARSRLSSNDFDRGRRQQQLLRAILAQGVDLGLVTEVPTLWATYRNSVETDLDIGRILQLAAMAPRIQENGIENLYLAGKTNAWTIPTSGAFVQLPIWEGDNMMEETFGRLFLPPALNRATRPPIYVEIINQTDNPDLAALAADNLAWHGFVPIITTAVTEPAHNNSQTTLRLLRPQL